jgi:hypothetical protein
MNCPHNRPPWSSFCDRCCLRANSGAMNALSFGKHAQGLMLWRAIGLGLAIVLVEKSSLTIVSVLRIRLDRAGAAAGSII